MFLLLPVISPSNIITSQDVLNFFLALPQSNCFLTHFNLLKEFIVYHFWKVRSEIIQ
jgi:hypothetical protein